MKEHTIFKGKDAENKNIAYSCGMKYAKKEFEYHLEIENQLFHFKWTNPVNDIIKGTVCLQWPGKRIDNIDELSDIAYQAAEIEFAILKESYINEHGSLPEKYYLDEELIEKIVYNAKYLYPIYSINVFRSKMYEKSIFDADILNELYLEQNSQEELVQGAIESARESCQIKEIRLDLEEKIIQKIVNYYNDFSTLAECVGFKSKTSG